MKYSVITFGCRVNQADSLGFEEQLRAGGAVPASPEDADVVVVVAGMEGALASIVGGLTPAPVVAVPTSVGYGAALEGVTALLAMLASCAAGITVDIGLGATEAARDQLGIF